MPPLVGVGACNVFPQGCVVIDNAIPGLHPSQNPFHQVTIGRNITKPPKPEPGIKFTSLEFKGRKIAHRQQKRHQRNNAAGYKKRQRRKLRLKDGGAERRVKSQPIESHQTKPLARQHENRGIQSVAPTLDFLHARSFSAIDPALSIASTYPACPCGEEFRDICALRPVLT
jgi:hypothetical protein